MPTAPATSADLVDLLRKSGIVPQDKLASLSDLAIPDEPQKAAAAIVAQGFATRFQAQQLLAGRHKGFRIGAYLILDMLGRGGMGAVYLAEHLELHRKVAIKVLVPGRDEDQKLALERFLREARAAAALDHPNIVRIFDVARHNEVPYLVMEHVEGETLQQVLDRDGAVPYPTATEYIAQAAAGLQHAFEKGFIHRDIKPGNLMRDKNGTVKILDMGLARSASSSDNLTERLDNGAVVGTADFIAPEQALNQPNIDVRADIYSLGATFFALIIGKPPFEGNTTQKLLQHQLRSAPRIAALDATLAEGAQRGRREDAGEETGGPLSDSGRGDRGARAVDGEQLSHPGRHLAHQSGSGGRPPGHAGRGWPRRQFSPVAGRTDCGRGRSGRSRCRVRGRAQTGAVASAKTTRERAKPVRQGQGQG